MANHLHLQHTLLECDLQGNLTIFSNGRSIFLQARDVPQFLTWLSTDQPSEAPPQHIAHSHFMKKGKHILIDSHMTIPIGEVPRIISWLRQWSQKSQAR